MLGIISDSYPSANGIEIINENILWSALFLSALWIGIIIVICIMIIYRYQFKNIVYIILLVNILFSLTYCTIANIYVYNKINYFIQNHNPNSIMYIDLDTLSLYRNENFNGILYIKREDCGFCTKFEPVLLDYLKEHELSVYCYNTSGNREKRSKKMYQILEQYNIEGVPTLIICKNGEPIKNFYGPNMLDEMEKFIK